ncbi:hypothetical protein C1645_830984 [Glomus cerebriforme]|uniref:Uncharacterized protein n=1 Tax=Glomus cerebriforme TaxID=658196 RepID=A0A397SRK4_9GLOM|nr:hypothetical protein C1645_830984 [Glomus cerebriforme]
MNIIALMPATEAYEILLRNWGGLSTMICCMWEEDSNRNFITYVPPDVPHNSAESYCTTCATFEFLGDVRNGILTQKTLDNTTTYWVNLQVTDDLGRSSVFHGGYNSNTCFHVFGGEGGWIPRADLDEAPYEECQKIRDSK